MGDTSIFRFKSPTTFRLSQDENELNAERIMEMFPEFTNETPVRTVINSLVDRAATQTTKLNKPRAEDAEKIQSLENEIGRLKTLYDLDTENADQEIQRLGTLVKDLQQLLTQANETPSGLILESNQAVITFNPIVAKLLDLEAQAAGKRTGKPFSREDILKNLFWDTIRRVSNYPLVKLYSSSELTEIARSLKTSQE